MTEGTSLPLLTLNAEKLGHIQALAEMAGREGVRVSVTETCIVVDPAFPAQSEDDSSARLARSKPLIAALAQGLLAFANTLVKTGPE